MHITGGSLEFPLSMIPVKLSSVSVTLSASKMIQLAFLLLHPAIIVTIGATCESNAALFSVTPKSYEQVHYLRKLNLNNATLDFWLLTTLVNREAHIKVPVNEVSIFQNDLLQWGLQPKIINSNLTACINTTRSERFARYNSIDSLDITKTYLRYSTMNHYIDYLGRKYSDIVSISTVGSSYDRRLLRTVTISQQRNSLNSQAILIDAGIHAREWLAPATALYVINQLVQHSDENHDLLNNLTWIILPLVNPDGYEHSLTKDKFWRKNRHPFRQCVGSDVNRNFDFHWGEKGVSRHECGQTYPGPKPFSEPEARVVRKLLLSKNDSIKFYLTLHSYGRYLMYPWGYRKGLPQTWRTMDTVARAGAAAMKQSHNVNYKIGGAGKILYEASGGSDDYALAIARIPIALIMELPGDERGFHPAASKLKPFLEEAFTGIRAMALKMMQLTVSLTIVIPNNVYHGLSLEDFPASTKSYSNNQKLT